MVRLSAAEALGKLSGSAAKRYRVSGVFFVFVYGFSVVFLWFFSGLLLVSMVLNWVFLVLFRVFGRIYFSITMSLAVNFDTGGPYGRGLSRGGPPRSCGKKAVAKGLLDPQRDAFWWVFRYLPKGMAPLGGPGTSKVVFFAAVAW